MMEEKLMCALKRTIVYLLGAILALTLLPASAFAAETATSAAGGAGEVPVSPISLGGEHSAAIKKDGALWVWGSEGLYDGQLGTGKTNGRLKVPVQIGTLHDLRAVSSGSNHSAAIRSDGTLWAWGNNAHGQVGDGTNSSRSAPVKIPLESVSQVSMGLYHSAAVTSDGSLWTWGTNSSGQLGNGTTESSSTPVKIEGMDDVLTVAMGDFHSAAVKNDGSLWMWGRSSGGALGNGDKWGKDEVLSPIEVMQGVATVSLGCNVSAAVKLDGTLWTWGNNGYGQLGDGTEENRAEPRRVEGIDNVVAVSFGTDFAAAIKADGTLWMWGQNKYGQLGDGTTEAKLEPTRVKGLDNVVAVSLGNGHTAALTADGSLWMWGWGINGQLGTGETKNNTTPVLVMKDVMLPGAAMRPAPEPDDEEAASTDYNKTVRTLFASATDLGSATIEGPKLDLFGEQVTLFRHQIGVDSFMTENLDFACTFDTETNVLSVLVGKVPNNSGDDEMDKAKNIRETSEWKEVSSFINACKQGADAKTIRNKFLSLFEGSEVGEKRLVFEGDGYCLGYLSIQLDSQRRIVGMPEGGIATGVSIDVSGRAPLWGIVYSELGIGGSIDGTVGLSVENSRLKYVGNLDFGVTPSIAVGADVFVMDVKGGLAGSLDGSLGFPSSALSNALRVSLSGRLFISVDSWIPGLSNEYSYDFPALELYPHLGEVTPQVAALAFEAPEACSVEDLAELQDDPSLLSDTVAAPVASTVYENAKPSVVQLSDGRYLCTYLDTVADGTVQLMYRVLSNGKWSDAKPVAPQSSAAMAEADSLLSQSAGSNARVDTAGALATASDGSTWVVYERSAKTLDSGMTPEEIARLMELRAARFDASSATFGESIVVAPAGTWKYGYSIGELSDDKPAVVWAENSANDVLLKSGGTRLYRAELSEGAASPATELFSCGKVVTEALAFGDHYAFVEGGKLYVDGAAVNTATLGSAVDGLHESGGTLFFRCDGKLCSYAPGEGAQLLGARCAASFVVRGNHVYWIEQDGFYSEIYRSDLAGGSIAAVTEDDAYVGNFDVIANTSGDGLLYTCQSVNPSAVESGGNPFGVTVLKYGGSLTRTQVEIVDAAYDVMEFDPSVPNRVVATVENTGTELATGVTVEARDGNGNVVATGTLGKTIAPGESAEVELSVTFPEGSTSFDLSFAIASNGSAFAPSGATLAMEVEHDIALARKKWQLPGNYHLVVTNKEPEAVKGVKLHLYDGGEGGRLIRTIDVGTLGANASKPVTLRESDWSAATVNTAASAKTIYCVIEHDGIEYSLSDNSAVLTRAVTAQGKPDDGSQGGATKPTTPSNPVTPSQPANPTKPTSPSKPSAAQKTSLAKAAITVKSKAYTGKTQKPAVPVVKVGGKTLRNGIDFTYSCKGGKKIGAYKVTIVGKGSYTGTKTASFQIVPKGTSLSKLTKAKKALTVKWKKPSKTALKQVAGYEIRYSTSKKFTAKTTKVKRVKASSSSGKKCTLKVSKLKGGKKYYVQVRTYKKVGKATYYSSWSKVKAVKTKK